MEDPVPLERNLYGHFLAGLLWERQFEKVLLKHGWEKIPHCECLFVHRGKGLFLSVYVDDIKLAGKKHNIDPMWKVFNKEVYLGEPTFFLNHVHLGCIHRQCEVSQNIMDNYTEPCLNREFLRVEQRNFHSLKIFVFLHGRMTWWVMQRSVWNDIVSWETRRLINSTRYLLHALMTITSKRRKQNLLENCELFALKLFLNAYIWQELHDLIFMVNE